MDRRHPSDPVSVFAAFDLPATEPVYGDPPREDAPPAQEGETLRLAVAGALGSGGRVDLNRTGAREAGRSV